MLIRFFLSSKHPHALTFFLHSLNHSLVDKKILEKKNIQSFFMRHFLKLPASSTICARISFCAFASQNKIIELSKRKTKHLASKKSSFPYPPQNDRKVKAYKQSKLEIEQFQRL